jgi:hypothetical protein
MKRCIPATLAIVLSCLGVMRAAYADDDDDAPVSGTAPTASTPYSADPPSPAALAGIVRLSAAQTRAAGLELTTLDAVSLQSETPAFGKVLDIQPLLDLRARERDAGSEVEMAAAALTLAEKNRKRVAALHAADILAGRELAHSEAQWLSDRAREAAARRRVEDVHREARHLWGSELARLALAAQSPLLEALASHRRYLLQITLPPGSPWPMPAMSLPVAREFDRQRACQADFIAAAPRTDDFTQGETWFYHAPADHLRAGMRVTAWVPDDRKRPGIMLPASAVVWYAGQPWAYRKDADGSFIRTPVMTQNPSGPLWFVESGFAAGHQVVTAGAQTLLSEEFRGHIPSEDDD